MLSLIVAVALSQTQVDTQKCLLQMDAMAVFVVLEEPTYGRKLYNIVCSGNHCSGARLTLAKTDAEPWKVRMADLASMGSLRVQSKKGSVAVLDWGVSQFTIDFKEGRVIRTSKGERAEGRCAPTFSP